METPPRGTIENMHISAWPHATRHWCRMGVVPLMPARVVDSEVNAGYGRPVVCRHALLFADRVMSTNRIIFNGIGQKIEVILIMHIYLIGNGRYIPLCVVGFLFIIHNALYPVNIIASEVIYIIYFLLAVFGCIAVLACSVLGSPGIAGRRNRFRLAVSCGIPIALLCFSGFQGVQFASDVLGSRVVGGLCKVQRNLDSLAGAFVLQQPRVFDKEMRPVSLKFLMRAQYIHVGEMYYIRYGERSHYILTAERVADPIHGQ
jgi:hypothetical protein